MNPRHIALVVWTGIALIFVLVRARDDAFGLIKTALTPKLLVPAILSLFWNIAVVYGLYRLGVWNMVLWWDTAAFVFAGTTVLVWRMSQSRDFSRKFYGEVLLGSLALSVLLDAIVSTYTFGLPWELLLVPWLFLLGAFQAVVGRVESYAVLRKLVRGLIGLTGAAIFVRAAVGAAADYKGFFSLLTVQSLILAFALTLAYLPFLFALRVWVCYDTAFVDLRLGLEKPFSVRLYARLRVFTCYGLNLAKLERFRLIWGSSLRLAVTCEAVDRVLKQARASDG